ncbi:hypothetical protein V8C42DRAFT_335051 [Trichoderma barbatum]
MAESVLMNAPAYQTCRLLSKNPAYDTPPSSISSCNLKRKAQEYEDKDQENAHNSKKQRTVHHHDASPSASLPLASIAPPEPLSINGILRQRCRKRLYVTPLHWKLQQLDLLGCRFRGRGEEKKKINHNESEGHVQEPPSLQGQPQGQLQGKVKGTTKYLPTNEVIREASSCLRWVRLASSRAEDVQYLLEHCGMTIDNYSTLSFYFNGRRVAHLHTDGTFLRTSSKLDGPSLAFLNLRSVGIRRDNSIRPRRFKVINPPACNIRRRKQESIRPVNEAEDPYIAAVLIALAQEQQHQQANVAAKQENPLDREYTPDMGPKHYKVFVLALSALETPCLYFYTAQIPSSFLDRLDKPSQNIPSRPFRIRYHRIPLSPVKAMKRVLKFAISLIHDARDTYIF